MITRTLILHRSAATSLASLRGASRGARSAPTRAPPGRVVAGKRSRRPKAEKRGSDVAIPSSEATPSTPPPAPASSKTLPEEGDAPRGTSSAPPKGPPTDDPLPAVTRDQVLDSCLGTTAWMLGIAIILREATFFGRDVLPDAIGDWTATLPLVAALHPPFEPVDLASHAAVAVAAAATVTGLRSALLESWPDFRAATDRSNRQVLAPLTVGDLVTVSALPAVAEEALFRGCVIPALGGGPVGVIVSGMTFGALHVGGGRNVAFAAWASAVGCLYGACAVGCGDVSVAIAAHAMANYASATMWLEKNPDVKLR